VQKSGFIGLLKRQPELALCLIKAMGQHVRGLVALVDDLTLKDVKTRLANWLVQHCPNPDSTEPCAIELTMTKHMLATELGTGSETLSRTLATFRNQHLLSVAGKTITLLCPNKLTQFSGDGSHHPVLRSPGLFGEYAPDLQGHVGDFVGEEDKKRTAARSSRYEPALAGV
jgi:hypothetical protein